MKILFALLSIISFSTYAADGIYLSASALPIYGSGNDESTSSLLGTGVAVTAGVRLINLAFEGGVKQLTVKNKELGNDKYDTEIKDTVIFGGARLFFNEVFSLKAGLSSHRMDMDIYQGQTHLKSKEDDGEHFGVYAGMGILTELSRTTDLYVESTLYPVSDIGFYFVDMEIGIRFYL